MFKRVSIFFFLGCFVNLLAQPGENKSNATRITELHLKAMDVMAVNPKLAITHIREGLLMAKEQKNPAHELYLLIDLANWYLFSSLPDSALQLGKQNLKWAEKLDNDSLRMFAYSNLGVTYSAQGLNDSATRYHYKCLKLAEAGKHKREIIRSLFFLGGIYNSLGEPERAKKLFDDCYQEAEKCGKPQLIATACEGMASYYYTIESYDEALKYYQRALNLFSELNKQYDVARCHLNIGSVYGDSQKCQLSISEYEKALLFFERLGTQDHILLCYLNLGATFNNCGQITRSIDYYNKSEKLCRQNFSYDNLQVVYENLALAHKQTGNSNKALEYYEKFTNLKDSLLNEEKIKYISELQTKYEVEKKEHEKQLSQAEAALQKRRSYVWLSIACLLLALGAGAVLFYRQKIRNTKLMAEKNEELYRRKINEIIKEQELKSINEIMEGQENERKRIAEDLHDRLGSMLATVKLHFNALEQKVESLEIKSLDQYNKANLLLDQVCDEVRKIAHNMESGVLANFGLLHALTDLKEALEQSSHLKIHIHTFGMKQRLGHDIEISLYRVVQELLSNVIKHARATEVNIDLNREKNQLTLMVSDNGLGYDTAVAENKSGMGLRNIGARVARLKGKFYVDSGMRNGATSIIEIPLNDDTHPDS